MTTNVYAQAPNKMSYQAVIRNSSNTLVTNQTVGMRLSILQGSASGSSVYVETQVPTTNTNGLASIEIGGGTFVSGNFTSIDWANGPYFIQTEIDPSGSNNYTISGTSQLLSVPYALFSGNGIHGVSGTGDSLLLGNGTSIIIPGISAANNFGNHGGIVSNPGAGVTYNGYTYSSIILGNGQEWMAENLRTSQYANGDSIPNVPDASEWIGLTTGAWAHYNNESQFETPLSFGKLYNWYSVTDSRNVCPTGWHVPTYSEWYVLIDYLGGQFVAGGKMKSSDTQYWGGPNTGATNVSGFSGLPGGFRGLDGYFAWFGDQGHWWSSTESDTLSAWCYYLSSNDYVNPNYGNKPYGMSIRCLRD
jgi:uncharacterized protein (TIGR02145 family)